MESEPGITWEGTFMLGIDPEKDKPCNMRPIFTCFPHNPSLAMERLIDAVCGAGRHQSWGSFYSQQAWAASGQGCPALCPLCPSRLLDRSQHLPRFTPLPRESLPPTTHPLSTVYSIHSSYPSAIIKACFCRPLASLLPFYLKLCLIFKSIIVTAIRSSVL